MVDPAPQEPDVVYRPVFTYNGKKYRPGDLTGRQIERIENVVGVKYAGHDPVDTATGKIRDMAHALAYMAVMLEADLDAAAIEQFIASTRISKLDGMWSAEPDDLPSMYTDGIPS